MLFTHGDFRIDDGVSLNLTIVRMMHLSELVFVCSNSASSHIKKAESLVLEALSVGDQLQELCIHRGNYVISALMR